MYIPNGLSHLNDKVCFATPYYSSMATNITVSQNLTTLALETEPSATGLVLQCILYGANFLYSSRILS